jgi:uncharacterized protein YcbK (DUF882 family)
MKRKHDNTGRQTRAAGGDVSRRRMIGLGVAGFAAFLLPGAALANEWIRIASEPVGRAGRSGTAPDATPAVYRFPTGRTTGRQYVRSLAFYNLHTGENLNTAYWESGEYIPTALSEINYLFRDFRANEIKAIDPRLLDVLYDLQLLTGSSQPISLVSGYRTYATNAMLAAHSEGVARHSMHIEGKASDIRIPGVELRDLQRAALSLGAGGVGYYPQSNFVHVDTGRVRHWG